ncbi:fatty acid desaturase [Ilyomonas limi]|uniref:Fatty acid desaturase n=1 Tax=Ilyomonas limi TaxID=2575867 RepID=A0A4U3L4T5_9BACT|nr:fatty acid desaturase [Ilyomonas limi]TKK69349.1 fatty acid desaturase [Ilyomonas limi]
MRTLAKPVFMKVKAEQDLFISLRQQVMEVVAALEAKRWWTIKAKTILFPLLYVAAYAGALLWGSNIGVLYICYFLLGCFLLLNFLNLIHDAVHHTLFKQPWLNRMYVYFFDIMGANSYMWKIRHIRLHHNYPNVMGWDSDFEQSPMARVFPHGAYSVMHRYQHFYLPLLYPLYLFNWLLVRDYKDFFIKSRLVWKVNQHIPAIEYVKLFLFKIFFLLYTIVIPKVVLGISWAQIFIAFLIMMFTASIISLVVLLSPHATPESEFPLPDEKGMLPDTWFRHQLATTNDVISDSWFIRFFMGSFNYHIAHHLFPHINHVYYPEVTTVIEAFAKKHQLPYRTFTLSHSLFNHYRLLKANAVYENLFEETM